MDDEEQPEILLDLWSVLSELRTPSTFACGGEIPIVLPGLNIKGYGDVALPLRERDAKEILAQYQPAEKGLLQLDASNVQLLNQKFIDQINSLVVDTVAVELGLGYNANVEVQLHKLLLYEPGGIWQDSTEKLKGAFASLVVTLPSTFEGGEVIVTNDGLEMKFKPAEPTCTTTYTAFYNDCKHDIRPITSGYRLALLFNIVSRQEGPFSVPNNEAIFRTKAILKEWSTSDLPRTKAVILLKHTGEYTSELAFQTLRAEDRAMAQVLQQAIQGEDFELYLGMLDYTKASNLDSFFDNDVEEAYDLTQVIDANGDKAQFSITVESKDFYPSSAIDDARADSKNIDKANKIQKLNYRRAVLILFPKHKLIDIVCEGPKPESVAYLAELLKQCAGSESRDTPDWQNATRMSSILARKHWPEINIGFLDSLCTIGDVQLVQEHLETKTSRHFRSTDIAQLGTVLHKCLTKFGWDSLATSILKLEQDFNAVACIIFLAQFYSANIEGKQEREVLGAIARHLVIRESLEQDWLSHLTVEYLSKAVLIVKTIDPSLLPELFSLVERILLAKSDLIPTLTKLRELDSSVVELPEYIQLIKTCINFLQSRIDAANAREDDWSILIPLNCSCSKCQGIANFLTSPTETIFRHGMKYFHLQRTIGLHFSDQSKHKFAGLIELSDDNGTLKKIAKEVDGIKNNALIDEEKIKELSVILSEVEATEPAPKRRKLTHQK